jgi:hypothetical protein
VGPFSLDPTVLPTGRTPVSLVVPDLNADGMPDLAVTDNVSNDVTILLRD